MSASPPTPPRPPATSFEETLRQIVRDVIREEVRAIVCEELAAALEPRARGPQPEATQLYLTPKAAAAIANVSEKTLRRFIESGRLPASTLGRLIRIKRADLDDFLERGDGARAKRSTQSADEIALSILRGGKK